MAEQPQNPGPAEAPASTRQLRLKNNAVTAVIKSSSSSSSTSSSSSNSSNSSGSSSSVQSPTAAEALSATKQQDTDNEYDIAAAAAERLAREIEDDTGSLVNVVHFDKGQGMYSTLEFSGMRISDHESSVFETKSGGEEFYVTEEKLDIPKGPGIEVDSQNGKIFEDDTISGLSLSPLEKSSEVQGLSVKNLNNEDRVELQADLTDKIDQQVIEVTSQFYVTEEKFDILKGPGIEVDSQYGKIFEDDTISGLSLSPLEKSSEVQSLSVKNLNNEDRLELEADLTEKIDQQVIDVTSQFNVTEEKFDNLKGPGIEVDSQYGKNFEDDTISSLSLSPLEKSSEVQSLSVKNLNNGDRVELEAGLSEEIDQQVIEVAGQFYVTEEKFDIPKGPGIEVDSQYEKYFEDDTISGLSLSPLEKSSEVQSLIVKNLNNEDIVELEADLNEEIDQQVTELDLEAVLEKQETHNLYCPNCNSCITRRVILRRRKRKVRNLRLKPRPDKYGTTVESELVTTPENAANQGDDAINVSVSGSPPHADDSHTADRKVDIFRCLSCFSIFIPSGDGFNLFRRSGDSQGNENMPNTQKKPESSTNWLFSVFSLNKGKVATEQEDNHDQFQQGEPTSLVPSTGDSLVLGDTSHNQSSLSVGHVDEAVTEQQEVGKDIVNSSTQERIPLENVMINVEQKLDDAMEKSKTGLDGAALKHSEADTVEILYSSFFSETQRASRKIVSSGEPVENVSLNPKQSGVEVLVPSLLGSLTLEQSQKEIEQKSNFTFENKQAVQNGLASSAQGAPSPSQSFSNEVHINYATTEPPETGTDTVVSSTLQAILPEIEKISVISVITNLDDAARKNTGDDVILTVEEEPVEPAAPQTTQDTAAPVGAEIMPQTGTQMRVREIDAEVGEAREWDVLKSIVYGGLVESITSVGVVLSAAGGGASTLNILAMGLANLIGGIFVLGHNLIELKNDSSGEASNQTNTQEGRYQKALGRRENFRLHAVLAVLSFLIFGLVPPIVYGVLFRTSSSDRDLKLVAVAAASLICIIFLAIGKAHTQKPPKTYIKTLVYYVSIVIMTSGVSYIIGDLIKELLEKLGWFESAFTMPLLETRPTELPWSSY